MGIKMQEVRYQGKELKISEYDMNKEYSQLKCFYCNADVSFVKSHERNLGDRKITVHRFFRLKTGHEHEDGCKYTIDGAIIHIYDRCADNELMSKQDDKYVVRLLLVSDDIDGKSEKNVNNGPSHDKRGKNHITNGKKTAYLSTIQRVMRLRTMVERNSDLEEKLHLQFWNLNDKAHSISWKNFYYSSEEERDYGRLLKYLKNGSVYHPICVDGYIRSVKEYQKGKYCLEFEPVLTEKDERVAVNAYFDKEIIYEYLSGKENGRIVVYAKHKFHNKNTWNKLTYYNITGNIYDKKQIYIYQSDSDK